MEPTLMGSITAIFGAEAPVPELPVEPVPEATPPAEPEKPVAADIADLIEEARQHYNQAQQNLKAGDWAGYGGEMEALQAVLDRLAELATEE
jgi:hypothetical protein